MAKITIKTGNYGTQYAVVEGDGYPREISIESARNMHRHEQSAQVDANLKACGVSAITPASFAAWAEVQFADLVDAPEFVPAGTCPVCGLDLTEHPHGESECDALLTYEEVRFYDEMAQARIDYRYPNQF